MPNHDHAIDQFGERLANVLEARGITQAALAEKSGVDRSLVSRIIRGDRKPSGDVLRYIAAALEFDVADLVRGTEAEARLEEASHSVPREDYVDAIQKIVEFESRNRELESQIRAVHETLRNEEARRKEAEHSACQAHLDSERARHDVKVTREQIRSQEQELRRHRRALSRAVAQLTALRAKLRDLDEELASTRKSSRLSAILSGVAALTSAVTLAHFLSGNDSDSSTKATSEKGDSEV